MESATRARQKNNLEKAAFDSLRQDFLRAGKVQRKEDEDELEKELEDLGIQRGKQEVYKNASDKVREEYGAKKWNEYLALASVLIVWVAYSAVTPLLYWKLVDRGKVEGCDVKIVYWFVPISIYNKTLLILLRIGAVGLVSATFWLFLYAVFLTIKRFRGYTKQPKEKGVKKAKEKARLMESGDIPRSEAAQIGPLQGEASQVRPREAESSRDRRTESQSDRHSGAKENEVTREEKIKFEYQGTIRIGKKVLYWFYAFVLVVSLGFTIFFVVRTIQVNHIDMDKAPFSSTGQLLPFVTGLVAFMLVVWDCIMERIERRAEKKAILMIEQGLDPEKGIGTEREGPTTAGTSAEVVRRAASG